jgi:hypothetical protein
MRGVLGRVAAALLGVTLALSAHALEKFGTSQASHFNRIFAVRIAASSW